MNSLFAVIISSLLLLLALGMPRVIESMKVSREYSKLLTLYEEFNYFAKGYQDYFSQKKGWPETQLKGGQLPEGMDVHLDSRKWNRATPIGGHYYWAQGLAHNGELFIAAIGIENYMRKGEVVEPINIDTELFLRLDRKVDDGDLSSGHFRLGRRGLPLYVIEK